MRYLAIAFAIVLAAFTAWSMAEAPDFKVMTLASLGSISITPLDLVLALAVFVVVAANAFFLESDSAPMNRLVVWLSVILVGYQLFVVLPAAVLLHDLRAVDVVRMLEDRFELVLMLAVYGVVLRFCRPALVVAIFDAAAAALAIWVLYRYATHGATGYWQDGVFRLRIAWGGCSLLFGWLLLTSLWYWPVSLWRVMLASLAMIALVLTNHRSAFVAILVALAAQLVATGRVTRRVAVTLGVLAAMGAAVYSASPTVRDSVEYSVSTMFNANADSTSQDRVVRTRLAFDYFLQHPLGDYIWNQRYYLVGVRFDFVPHNFVVQRLVKQGVIAGMLFFAVISFTILIAWRNRADRTSAVMLSYLTFYLVFCALNATIDLPENQALFAVTVAMILHRNRTLQMEGEGSLRVIHAPADAMPHEVADSPALP